MEKNNEKKTKKKAWAEDVFESWGGYMEAKKAKLEEQYLVEAKGEYENTSTLFEGVSIFVNGYTDPSADVLRRLMQEHGGIYHQYLRPKQTTHLIASNLPYSKIVMYMKSKNPLPLCKPSWITDSIKAGKVLDFRNYLLYSQSTKFQPQLSSIFKSNSNQSTPDKVKCSKSASLQINEQQKAIKTNENSSVYESSSTSKGVFASQNIPNKFPTETEFSNDSISSKSSTPKAKSKNSLNINFKKIDFNESDSEDSKSSIAEKPIEENQEILNKSLCDANVLDSSKPSTSDMSNIRKDTKINTLPETSGKNKSSYSSICSKNSDFISEFYNNSRLHHIATMGATFKDYINELRDKSNGKFPGLERLVKEKKFNRPGPSTKVDSDSEDDIFAVDSSPNEILQENVIMHIDMDCFFVSVGIRNRPELKGQPVAVTHAKGNKSSLNADGNQEGSYSEIASCSYEARKFGLKNGMFLGQALKLCPNLKTIKYDFEGYKEVSYALYNTVASYTLDIEAVSCDEMYVNCSKIISKAAITPLEFADSLRKEIKEKTGCPVSTGFGANKLQARLATKKAKPDGKFHLTENTVLNYIGTLNAKDLPGVGYSTTNKLSAMGVKTCADLQTFELFFLQKEFGKKTGELLYNMCRGIDNSKLNMEHVRKSISAEVNYGIRFENHFDAEEFLKKLSVEVCTRLKNANAKGRCLTLKLMVRAKEAPKETVKFMGHGLCDYFTKSKNFIASVDDLSIITKEILNLWNLTQQIPEDIRGIGIQISRLEILKNKSNTNSLINFISKAKQASAESNDKEINKKSKKVSDCTQIGPLNPNSELMERKHDSEKTGAKSIPKESNFQANEKLVNFSKDKLILPSQDIDDSILNELPEEIRNEIAASKSATLKTDKGQKEKSKGSEKSIQSKQEFFFKEKKNIPRGKVELPPMQEIDMAVLVELPEDIRNEILNQYKSKTNSETTSMIVTPESKSETGKPKPEESKLKLEKKQQTNNKELNPNLNYLIDEKEFSFSQVDPEFLAALPEDIKDDVQMFCMMKRREKSNEEKKKIISTKSKGSSKAKILNPLKPKSTRGRKPKNVLGRMNSVPSRMKEVDQIENKIDTIKQLENEKINVIEEEQETTEKEINTIIAHMRSFSGKDIKSKGQEKALSTLIKCMFDLSTDQIRMQIQSWVSNSEFVNDTDILSLATYLSMLPGKKLIEDLHVLLKCMHRCITNSGNCVWHKAYSKIVDHVQYFMQIEYNCDLMVPMIRCNLHKCRSVNIC